MEFSLSSYSLNFCLIVALLLIPNGISSNPPPNRFAADQTRSIALLFSYIQCFPPNPQNLDPASQELLQIHQTFDPRSHLSQYTNLVDIQNLLAFVDQLQASHTPVDLPFTNAPGDIAQLEIILRVLYHNAQNWSLFYQTSAWLLQRVNTAQLFWAVMIVSAEKYGNTVAVPSSVEIFPQIFLPKNSILAAAGITDRRSSGADDHHPLQYWMRDPGLNDFHVQWHILEPFWWNEAVYGVTRHRKGELFLYFHHQIICRYNVERASHGLGEVEPLGLHPNYVIVEGDIPDIVNINYADFFSRPDGKRIGEFDDGVALKILRLFLSRLEEGIEQGFFLGRKGNRVGLRGRNGTDIVGATAESSTVKSANRDFYGSLHNSLHRVLVGTLRPKEFPVPGIQAHSETSMRDPVFYQIHKRVDTLFVKYKRTLPPYSQEELDFPGISIQDLEIKTGHEGYLDKRHGPVTLTTYFRTDTYDISNAARPCRAITEEPIPVQVRVLDHVPFEYVIRIQSKRPRVSHGMVRIFMWPEFNHRGIPLEGDAAHERAIELDRFLVQIDLGKGNVITRSSLDSTLTKREHSPGIKELFRGKDNRDLLANPKRRSACGFPNNLLIPRGNEEGIPFRLVVYVSEEDEPDFEGENRYPHYPFCGALNGHPFPDGRPMGFPFDRPGTRFQKSECSQEFGCSSGIRNAKEIRVIVKHVE